MAESGKLLADPQMLLRAQEALISQQMQEIVTLKEELKAADQQKTALKKELEREKERFLRSLQSVLGMVPTLRGHEMGEFVAACIRADASEFQVRDALRLYEKAEQEAPIQIDTLAKQMADVLREKR